MKILVKMPTRSRPNQALRILDALINNCKDIKNTKFVLTCDEDDKSMNNSNIIKDIEPYQLFWDVNIDYDISNNKIHAVNRDMEKYQDWDVVVLTSDDMIPIEKGYDEVIRTSFKNLIPDLDGVLYSPDGYTNLNTLPILGRKYYERFGFIYDPRYKSFFCDNIFHIIAEKLGKHYHIQKTLFKHEHPCNNGGVQSDELYIENNKYWTEDQETFKEHLKELGIENNG